MTTETLKQPSLALVKDDRQPRPMDQFKQRRSKEIVIGLSGPIGCGIKSIAETTTKILEDAGYKVYPIKLSTFIEDCIKSKKIVLEAAYSETRAARYYRLQDGGKELRKASSDILAEFAIRAIAVERTSALPENVEVTDELPSKNAYLIDQLKHPDEVKLLRTVYGNIFYLVGVLSVYDKRKARLLEQNVDSNEVESLMERDRREADKLGQQLDKTLLLSDFFIRNDRHNIEALEKHVKRFIDLIHGTNGVSPTKQEYGMYVAYAAQLKSACLSRQVGASITDKDGNIVATGTNDVPAYGGGLYSTESGSDDARCIKLGGRKCFNDFHKLKVRDEVHSVITKFIADTPKIKDKLEVDHISEIADIIYSSTRMKDLIEFSRSVHAEMDALISVARHGGKSVKNGILYTTTFPCHSCARHIVAAGIERVYYIEPYEKSLAGELHNDSIDLDPEEFSIDGSKQMKVQFFHFEGVAPRQYINFFLSTEERKDTTGRAVLIQIRNAEKAVPQYLDDYREFEAKVVKHLSDIFGED